MGATRLASGIKAKAHTPNKGSQTALITRLFVGLCLKNPDAGRVAPISGSVLYLRLVVAFFADFVNAPPNQNDVTHRFSICAM